MYEALCSNTRILVRKISLDTRAQHSSVKSHAYVLDLQL